VGKWQMAPFFHRGLSEDEENRIYRNEKVNEIESGAQLSASRESVAFLRKQSTR
jgi:hypothetical protein